MFPCISYLAKDEEVIREHAGIGDFPAIEIAETCKTTAPTTARIERAAANPSREGPREGSVTIRKRHNAGMPAAHTGGEAAEEIRFFKTASSAAPLRVRLA